MKSFFFRKRSLLLIPLAFLFLFLIIENFFYSEGLGLLRAGPFKFVLKTKDIETDFIITIDNRFSSNWLGVYGEGGYYKIAKVASNHLILVPRDWIYSKYFLGKRKFTGTIYHPKFIETYFEIFKSKECSGQLQLRISTFHDISKPELKCINSKGPLTFEIQPVSVEHFIRNSDSPINKEVYNSYKKRYDINNERTIQSMVYFSWHMQMMKEYLFLASDPKIKIDVDKFEVSLKKKCGSLISSADYCENIFSNNYLNIESMELKRERNYDVY